MNFNLFFEMEEIFRKIEDNIFGSQDGKIQNLNSKDISDDTTVDSSKEIKYLKKGLRTEAKNKRNSNLQLPDDENENEEDKKDKKEEKEEKNEKEEYAIDEDEYADYGRIDKTGIHFQLISDYNVSVEIVPDDLLRDDVKKLLLKYNGVFDYKMNLWVVPYVNYESLYKELNEIEGINKKLHKVGSIAKDCYEHKCLTTLIIKRKKKEETIDYTKDSMIRKVESLPDKLRNALYGFQVEGVKFGIEHHCRFLLADEMGVGKTIQAISLAYIYRDSWPVLIVCPGSMKYLWKGEIQTWLGLKNHRINILNSSRQRISEEAYFYIISYDLVRNVLKKLRKMIFDFVILDEAHSIKNKDSLRARNILPIAIRAKRLILMTGTPLLAKPYEGYPLLYALRPDLFGYFKKFAYRYCDPQPTPFGISWSGTSNTKELHWLLSTLMVRRLKKDILNDLPPKRRQKVLIKTDPEIIQQIKEVRTAVKGRMATLESYTLTAVAKKEGVCEYISDTLESTDEKIIVFAYHHEMLNRIESLVKNNKIDYIRIDGTTKQDKRYEYVNLFQKKISCRVAILSIIAASTGITLNSAHIVIFAELTWTPSIMIQAEDRAHRIGQKSEFVDIKYLYGQETLDDFILDKLQKKLTIVSTTIDDKKENFGVKANPELIHARSSQELIEKDKGEFYSSESETGEDIENNSKNIENKMLNDLNLDYDLNGNKKKGKNKRQKKKANRKKIKHAKSNNDIDTEDENKIIVESQSHELLKNPVKYPKEEDIYIDEDEYSDDDNLSDKTEDKKEEKNENDLDLNKVDNQGKEETKNDKKRRKTPNISDGKIKYKKKLSAIQILKKAWASNDKPKSYDKYKKKKSFKDQSSEENINEKKNNFNNNINNKNQINKIDEDIKNDNLNEKPINGNQISKNNYFKDFEDNLLINLHKVNMRRNISQEDTKRTEKSLDTDNIFKTQQKRLLFPNINKNIFNENNEDNKKGKYL